MINQRERLTPDSIVSKYGRCPRCSFVELEIDNKGYIICSICKDPHGIEIYHSFT